MLYLYGHRERERELESLNHHAPSVPLPPPLLASFACQSTAPFKSKVERTRDEKRNNRKWPTNGLVSCAPCVTGQEQEDADGRVKLCVSL